MVLERGEPEGGGGGGGRTLLTVRAMVMSDQIDDAKNNK